METSKSRTRTIDRVLYFVLLEWVSDAGRLALRLLSLDRLHLPKTDSLSYEVEIEKRKGFAGRIWFSAKTFVIDMLYFFVGLIVLTAIFFLTIYIAAITFGPIPPIHEWW